MPKGFPTKLQAEAAAEVIAPKWQTELHEESYGWTVDIHDGEGSIGSIVQDGSLNWWLGKRIKENREPYQSDGMRYRSANKLRI